jgi:hypothetical protein
MKTFNQFVNEATQLKWKGGRPKGGAYIENEKFWDMPDSHLNYVIKDAGKAVKTNPKGKKAGKYADEVNDASTVLYWRKKNKVKVPG